MKTPMFHHMIALGLSALMTAAVLVGLDGLAFDGFESAQVLAQALLGSTSA
jgi:hypothetical protein